MKPVIYTFLIIMLVFLSGCTEESHVEDDMQEMTFSLRTNYAEFSHAELSISLFEDILNSFEPDIWDFMVLSPSKPINGSTFIQVGAPQEIVDFQYTLEIGFYSMESGLTMYRSYTTDKDVVLHYIIDYWQEQKLPDISSWKDVSEEMR